jgi:integrase
MWCESLYSCPMARTTARRRGRERGQIEELPSGSLRVTVYAGVDPLTKRRHYLREVIAAGPTAHADAKKALRRLVVSPSTPCHGTA